MVTTVPPGLGEFLRSRRARLDPTILGYAGRRRTRGLRREEVAQRANISATWYTWLEQGRGGAPSAHVLERIADALMLTQPEREHLFVLGLGRPPERRVQAPQGITPRLQRLLDSLPASPALLKNAMWDVVGWNRAASVVLTDYGALAPSERNILRILFSVPGARERQPNWESVARFAVGAFRVDLARAGFLPEAVSLVDELCGKSPEFATLWRANEVYVHGEGTKRLQHATLGWIELDYSTFAVDGRADLGLVVMTPVDPTTASRIATLASKAIA